MIGSGGINSSNICKGIMLKKKKSSVYLKQINEKWKTEYAQYHHDQALTDENSESRDEDVFSRDGSEVIGHNLRSNEHEVFYQNQQAGSYPVVRNTSLLEDTHEINTDLEANQQFSRVSSTPFTPIVENEKEDNDIDEITEESTDRIHFGCRLTMPNSDLKFKNTINESEGSIESLPKQLILKPIIKYSDTNLSLYTKVSDLVFNKERTSEENLNQQFGKSIKVDMSDIKSSDRNRQNNRKRIWYVLNIV